MGNCGYSMSMVFTRSRYEILEMGTQSTNETYFTSPMDFRIAWSNANTMSRPLYNLWR